MVTLNDLTRIGALTEREDRDFWYAFHSWEWDVTTEAGWFRTDITLTGDKADEAKKRVCSEVAKGLGSGYRPTYHDPAVELYLANAIRAELARPGSFIVTPFRNGTWLSGGRYNPTGVTPNTLRRVREALETAGLLDYREGTRDYNLVSRIRPTDALVNILNACGLLTRESVKLRDDAEVIILREKKVGVNRGKYVEYEDDPVTVQQRALVRRYNKMLAAHDITISSDDLSKLQQSEVRPDLTQTSVRRIYAHGSFALGGRFYGGFWQQLGEEHRKLIRIDGMPVVEHDYAAMIISQLYAQKGIDYWHSVGVDPYLGGDYEGVSKEEVRSLFKTIMIICVNSSSRKVAEAAITEEISTKNHLAWAKELEVHGVVEEFLNRHNHIRSRFFVENGLPLQYEDSRIAEFIISKCLESDIPVLTVHDSFLVKRDDSAALKAMMVEGYERVVGYEPRIK